MPTFLMVKGVLHKKNKAVVTETILRHYFHYPSTVCVMKYGAVRKSNPVILRLLKENQQRPFKTAPFCPTEGRGQEWLF